MNTKLIAYLLVFFITGSAEALDKRKLGTHPSAVRQFTSNFRTAITRAFPAYKKSELEKKLKEIKSKYPGGIDTVKFNEPGLLTRLSGKLGIQMTRNADLKSKALGYKVDPKRGEIYFERGISAQRGMSERKANRYKKRIKKKHLKILKSLGIKKEHIINASLHMEKSGTSKSEAPTRLTDIRVESVFSYVHRVLDGIIVDGSEARVYSNSPNSIESVDITWPAFRIHPQLTQMKIKTKQQLVSDILEKVSSTFPNGYSASIKVFMAVVFRSVMVAPSTGSPPETYFIPAMRVGILEKNKKGQILYFDMAQQHASYMSEEAYLRSQGVRNP